MKIDGVKIYGILLPFGGPFEHAKRKGAFAKNVVVEVIAEKGVVKGYGEGAPREFVTGETQEGAIRAIQRMVQEKTFPWEIEDFSHIGLFFDGLINANGNHAAQCALETALFDAYGKWHGLPVSHWLDPSFMTNRIRYGGTIPLGKGKRRDEICDLLEKWGIQTVRVKLGTDLDANAEALEMAQRRFRMDHGLRADVNGAWDANLALKHLEILTGYNGLVVEQPLAAGDTEIVLFADALFRNNIQLMADESVCSLWDLEKVISQKTFQIVNIRLSKCGGLRKALKMIDMIRFKGLSFQIGCQLGESGILSAAGRTLALLCRDALYYDGSYDALLLEENITTKNITFDYGGWAGPLEGGGFGAAVDRHKLKRLSMQNLFRSLEKPAKVGFRK
jgi:muconate cycloisomerase